METSDGSLDYSPGDIKEVTLIGGETMESLEAKLGFKICPLAAEGIKCVGMFRVYRGAEEQTVYLCSKRGQVELAVIKETDGATFSYFRPCSEVYAKTRKVFIAHKKE